MNARSRFQRRALLPAKIAGGPLAELASTSSDALAAGRRHWRPRHSGRTANRTASALLHTLAKSSKEIELFNHRKKSGNRWS